MADIEKLKKIMVFVRDQMCHKTDCIKCDYNNPDGICYSISDIMRDTLSVIEQMEQEIERLKARKPDCDHAEHDSDGCLGYGRSEQDDEPIDACKKCEKYTGKDCENDG